jgi:hypothetical protein
LDSIRKEGLEVERPIVPISLQISEDPRELADPFAYPIKVWDLFVTLPKGTHFYVTTGRAEALGQGIGR